MQRLLRQGLINLLLGWIIFTSTVIMNMNGKNVTEVRVLTFYLERKALRYLLCLTCIVLVLFATAPYWLALIGVIGTAVIVIGACSVPLFFIVTMLMGKDYKDRDR
ncbi:hypothetical protein PP175_22615 [Aneurinibacillus sp. Ricciae_BoGa-3]|uniref:hypothetical protein n=1 Tax=Aneurinibacillus sp. Ricciae_BoGa-3 TaxID=3022697 RepID=UPI002342698E|nr:hypothetical protein [Aneurinibacillus sp. Ricciae_BoGa-3]WCK54071.1 hypothetical protein PP175_22615 [Aneurinibacillus sp. Ricciae_BoGa-3]